MWFAVFSTSFRLTENPFRYTPHGYSFRTHDTYRGTGTQVKSSGSYLQIRQLPKKKRQIAAHFIGRFVRQTNMPLSHVGEAFNRLGKTVNGFVGITMFNAVTHTVFDMSLKNNAAAAVQS